MDSHLDREIYQYLINSNINFIMKKIKISNNMIVVGVLIGVLVLMILVKVFFF